MEKTREKSFLNIKSKLMAAVAMLLVAFFMVISSSYAWFTLSTAPEVTGIKTSVGANGSLEIALLDSGDDKTTTLQNLLEKLASEVTTSTATLDSLIETNKTWGNLVAMYDATNPDPYGLGKITLLPSRLNATGDSINLEMPLLTPIYTSNGKITEIKANTNVGKYDATNGVFTNGGTGVRGIGTISSTTPEELAYKQAMSTYNSAMKAAANTAKKALSNNQEAFVNLSLNLAYGADTLDITPVIGMLDVLSAADTGVVASLKTAAASIIKAAYASEYAAFSNQFTTYVAISDVTIADDFASATINVNGIEAVIVEKATIDGIISGYSNFATTAAKIATDIADAKAKLTEVTSAEGYVAEQVSAADVKAVLNYLINMDTITFNDKPMSEVKTSILDDQGNLALDKAIKYFANGMNVSLNDGSGVFADIDKATGYEVSVSGTYMVPYTIKTVVTEDYNAPMKGDVNAPVTNVDTTTAAFTDLYGYALDFAFRTNASNSNLLLQTAPVDRIYTENTDANAETMGHGSTMTFNTTSAEFDAADIAKLTGGIRIIFTDSNGKILAVAAAQTDADGNVVYQDTTDGVTVSIYLYEYTILNGVMELGTMKENKNDAVITELTANTAEVVSAYVYLDGDIVDSSYVASDVTESMTGSINLQFSSSATLKPMEYSPLMNGTSTGSDTPAQGGEGN